MADKDRTLEQALDALVWAEPQTSGELRFYDSDGTPLAPEEIAKRKTPDKMPAAPRLIFDEPPESP